MVRHVVTHTALSEMEAAANPDEKQVQKTLIACCSSTFHMQPRNPRLARYGTDWL